MAKHILDAGGLHAVEGEVATALPPPWMSVLNGRLSLRQHKSVTAEDLTGRSLRVWSGHAPKLEGSLWPGHFEEEVREEEEHLSGRRQRLLLIRRSRESGGGGETSATSDPGYHVRGGGGIDVEGREEGEPIDIPVVISLPAGNNAVPILTSFGRCPPGNAKAMGASIHVQILVAE